MRVEISSPPLSKIRSHVLYSLFNGVVVPTVTLLMWLSFTFTLFLCLQAEKGACLEPGGKLPTGI